MRPWHYLIGGLCVVNMAGTPQRPYLQVVGPTPLRFSTPPRKLAELPPISTSSELTTNQDLQEVSGPMPMALAATSTTATNTLLQSPKVIANVTVPIDMVQPETSLVPTETTTEELTTQTLMKFFRTNSATTNRADTGILLPFGFVPPRPNPVPSSSATYTSP
jgi:hypothetical protein